MQKDIKAISIYNNLGNVKISKSSNKELKIAVNLVVTK